MLTREHLIQLCFIQIQPSHTKSYQIRLKMCMIEVGLNMLVIVDRNLALAE